MYFLFLLLANGTRVSGPRLQVWRIQLPGRKFGGSVEAWFGIAGSARGRTQLWMTPNTAG
ncbi:MAG: hypothetical protein ABI563_10765 [Specibacter sp.]